MNDETPVLEDALGEQAMLYALGALNETERAQFETCMTCSYSRAGKLAAEYHDLVATLTAATLPACEPPPAEVKVKIMAAIQPQKAAAPELSAPVPFFLPYGEQQWNATPYPGVRVCNLSSASPEFSVVMVDMVPGATFPPHDHHGAEDVYILSGDAHLEGRVMVAGDFMHSQPGTHHRAMISPGGCRAMLITSRNNYSPRLARAYGVARKVVARVARTLGAKVPD